MTVSSKQLEANRKNAQQGGVKTLEGKAIVKYNALKHGLLAKEVVITTGDGAESARRRATVADLQVGAGSWPLACATQRHRFHWHISRLRQMVDGLLAVVIA